MNKNIKEDISKMEARNKIEIFAQQNKKFKFSGHTITKALAIADYLNFLGFKITDAFPGEHDNILISAYDEFIDYNIDIDPDNSYMLELEQHNRSETSKAEKYEYKAIYEEYGLTIEQLWYKLYKFKIIEDLEETTI